MPRTLVVRDYLLLGLRLGRLVPGTVDTYTGDMGLRRHAAAGPPPAPGDLVATARRLRAELPGAGLGEARTLFLDAQLTALECTARRLAGEPIGFVDEVRACYDVRIAAGREDDYRAAHRRLDDLLPGPGPLADRLAAFRRREAVPAGLLGRAVEVLAAALRARTTTTVALPDGERVDFELVRDRPWTGFTRYLGGLRSRVEINADAGLRASQLVRLVAHEAYPGHHTEHCLVRGRPGGPAEHGIVLVSTPQSLVGEGAAEVGLDVLVGPGWGRWAADLLAEVGMHSDGELAEAVETELGGLAAVRQDAALMLHARGATTEEALAHLRRWLLVSERRAHRLLRFLTHPLWRTYTTTYVEGAALVRAWLARPGADPVADLRHLLAELPVPATLRAQAAGTAVVRRLPDRFRAGPGGLGDGVPAAAPPDVQVR